MVCKQATDTAVAHGFAAAIQTGAVRNVRTARLLRPEALVSYAAR